MIFFAFDIDSKISLMNHKTCFKYSNARTWLPAEATTYILSVFEIEEIMQSLSAIINANVSNPAIPKLQ